MLKGITKWDNVNKKTWFIHYTVQVSVFSINKLIHWSNVILFLHVIEILMVKIIYFDNIRLLFSCNCSYYLTILFFVKGYIYVVQHCLLILLQLHENLYKNLDYKTCFANTGQVFCLDVKDFQPRCTMAVDERINWWRASQSNCDPLSSFQRTRW